MYNIPAHYNMLLKDIVFCVTYETFLANSDDIFGNVLLLDGNVWLCVAAEDFLEMKWTSTLIVTVLWFYARK